MGVGAAARTPPSCHRRKGGGTCTRDPLPRAFMAKSNVSAPIAPQDTAHPEPAAVWVDIKSLKPWDRNPRKNQPAIKPVADSIKRFGFGAPILARRADGEVIAGHTRILAAESLGLARVPVRYLDLDPAEAHLLALTDNKLNEKAEWDDAEVARILSEYGLEDAALAGWDSAELDKMAAKIPDFLPGTEDEQGDLDAIKPISCPNCGHEFRK